MPSFETPNHDPYDLNKLAKELAERDAANQNGSYPHSSGSVDLPELQPLAHGNEYLSAPKFDVEAFLLSRSNMSLSDLRTELREYFATLKEELVQLINDDYEAFISLSTDLQGEGYRLERVRYPMEDLRSRIASAWSQLNDVQNSVKGKLDRRAALRQEKAFLQLLLKISDSTTRLESLLLISNPSDGGGIATHFTFADGSTSDDKSKENRAKHLLRIATEYTQLLYHLEKASSEKSEFLEEMQWRVDRIKSRLSSDLEQHFTTVLSRITSSEKSELGKANKQDFERSRSLLELSDCLRAYDMLCLWRDAEDILRREVVRGFVKKNIHPGALSGPHSPMMPHTPFLQGTFQSSKPPVTPFTPAAFTAKQESFFQNSTDLDSSIFLLDENGGPLAVLYNHVLRFIFRDLKPVMDLADRLRTKSLSNTTLLLTIDDEATVADDERYFDILANVLWTELARSIMDDLGSQVFAVGKPNEFKKNYEMTQRFIQSIEFLAPSVHAIRRLRQHPSFAAFERRWQLPVYFQLRWKEIANSVEEALESKSVLSASKGSEDLDVAFLLEQSRSIWRALIQCWDADIFIQDLAPRFWRLTLQLLKRYQVWVEGVMPPPDILKLKSPVSEKVTSGGVLGSRSSTPAPPQDTQSPNRIAEDDKLLQQCATLMHDIKELERSLPQFYRKRIAPIIPEMINEESDVESLEEILKASLTPMTEMLPVMSTQVEDILIRRCCEALVSVKSLPGQFRATSQKHMPTKPSTFVPMILRPVKAFFGIGTGGDAESKALRKDFGDSLSLNIVEAVSSRYMTHLSAMKKNEESLRRLRTGQRAGFSLFGGSSSNADSEAKDDERVRTQLTLDVEAFGKDAEALGVSLDACPSFKSLNYMVHANVTEQ